ncbi:MAG: hypothetical protein U0Q12_01165 [Vicinamibacterales bacterium]
MKIRIVEPDHRKVPGTVGRIRKPSTVTGSGMRPSSTIGSKMTRISFACSSARDFAG